MPNLNQNNIDDSNYMMQLSKISIALLLLFLSCSQSFAAGLGKVHVKSALGEPLSAEIDIIESPSEQTTFLSARMGNSEEYSAAGLQYLILPPGVHAQIIRHVDNSRVIQIVSDRAVNDPFIELLVKMESSTVNILRQYTILLDPPYSELNEEGDESSREKSTGPLKNDLPVKFSNSILTDGFVKKKSRRTHQKNIDLDNTKNIDSSNRVKSPEVTESTYLTQSGDVFGKVAQQYQPAGVSLKKVMAVFYKANPDAFVNGDMNQLKAGQTLKVPKLDDLVPDSNVDKVKSQSEAKSKQPNKTPSLKTDNDAGNSKAAEDTTKFVLKVSPAEIAPQNKTIESKDNSTSTVDERAKDTSTPNAGHTDLASNLAPVSPNVEAALPASSESKEPSAQAVDNSVESKPVPAQANQPTDKPKSKPIVIETTTDQSFLNALLANVKWILIGMILPSIFFIAVLVLNKRRMDQMRALQESFYQDVGVEIEAKQEPQSTVISYPADTQEIHEVENSQEESLLAEDAIKTFDSLQPLGAPTVNESLKTENVAPTKEDTEIDIHEVDPLVEAEIYISYGRLEQAEGILKNALIKTPYRLELLIMLLKLYKDKGDKVSFEAIARDVYESTASGIIKDPVIWAKVALLGGKFDSKNPLYQIEGVSNDGHARPQDQDTLIFDDVFIDATDDISEVVSFEEQLPDEQLPLDELKELSSGESNRDDLDQTLDASLKADSITGLGLIEKEADIEGPELNEAKELGIANYDKNVIEFVLDDKTVEQDHLKANKSAQKGIGASEGDANSLDDLFGEHHKP